VGSAGCLHYSEKSMVYEFKSRAAETVILNQGIAEVVIKAIGREPGPAGVIQVADIPSAIAAIKAIESGKPDEASVAMHTSALVDMLERSHAGGKDVTWAA